MQGEERAMLISGPPTMSGQRAKFYRRPKQDEQRSLEEGRPVVAMVEYLEIITPGDKTLIIDRPSRPEDRQRFAAQYQAFARDQDQAAAGGTLLSTWAGVPPERVAEYQLGNVVTVEQLAALSDSVIGSFGPGTVRERSAARDWLDAMKGAAPTLRLQKELADRDSALEALKAQLAQQAAAIAALQAGAAGGTPAPAQTPPAEQGPPVVNVEEALRQGYVPADANGRPITPLATSKRVRTR